MKRTFLPILIFAPLAAHANVSYFNDFQGAIGPEWSSTSTNAVDGASRLALGEFYNESVTLTLSGFVVGQSASLSFDFLALDSWDGSTGGGVSGPDQFTVKAGATTLLDASFSVLDEGGYQQTYSAGNPLGGPLVAAYTDADEVDSLAAHTFYGSAVYKFDGSGANSGFSFVATSGTMTFTFTGSGLQGVGDEGWAIDNVRVVQNAAAVPGPVAALPFALMALRRRRKA